MDLMDKDQNFNFLNGTFGQSVCCGERSLQMSFHPMLIIPLELDGMDPRHALDLGGKPVFEHTSTVPWYNIGNQPGRLF
eukprot:scaffold91_cov254-Pinguiococcus_pyrenoidosus.AAC.47